MINYEKFAKFYDAIMGDREKSYTTIRQFIERYHPQAKSVLELGSGTGSVLKGLSDKYEVSGIELSEEMLKISREKVLGARLYRGDISNFNLNQTFDVVICVYDTINHLTEFSQWQAVFERASFHLNPSGLFIFDINTLGRLEMLSRESTIVKEFDGNTMQMKVEKINNEKFDWDIKITDANQRAYSENIIEVSFSIERISTTLSQYFDVLELFTFSELGPHDTADKAVYFVCQVIKN